MKLMQHLRNVTGVMKIVNMYRSQTFQDTCIVCEPVATAVTSRGLADGSVQATKMKFIETNINHISQMQLEQHQVFATCVLVVRHGGQMNLYFSDIVIYKFVATLFNYRIIELNQWNSDWI